MSTEMAQGLAAARQRLETHALPGLETVLLTGLLALWLGLALAAWGGGYRAGFVEIHALLRGLLPDVVWAALTRFGDERLLLALTLLFVRHRPEVFWAMLLSALIGALEVRGLKPLVDALRPPAVLPQEALEVIGPVLRSHSFPSGHTASAFVFFGVLAVFARHRHERVAALGAAALVGASRVALGVHWPQDVLAGAFLGAFAAALGSLLARRWPGGLRPAPHAFLRLVPLAALPLLLLDDAGNPAVDWLIWPLVFSLAARFWMDHLAGRR